jgi:hypothetical protein
MTYKGTFKPRNPNKYRGDPSNIIYRSRWEYLLMDRFDKDSNVLWWQSEELAIPYRSPIDGKVHRYFPDFLVYLKDQNNTNKTIMVEVKPAVQTKPPILKEGQNPRSKKYINEVCTWGVNDAKWKAAKNYCADRKYEFMIITEKELGLTF